MRRAIFILLAACSSSTSTAGAQGHADFSYLGVTATTADKPIAAGSDVTVQVDVRDPANASFESSLPDVLRVVSSAHGSGNRWFVVLHAQNEGKSRLTVKSGSAVVDTLDLVVSPIAKL